MRKLTIDEARDVFKTRGFILLDSEYVSSKSKMKSICICGAEFLTTLENVRSGKKCKECGKKNTKEKQSLSQQEVESIFEINNCKLLDNYVNYHTPLTFFCRCGKQSSIDLAHFKRTKSCQECGKMRSADAKRLSPDFVKSEFEKCGYTLLDQFSDSDTHLKAICPNGHEIKMDWDHFKIGNRCKICYYENNKGENHANWNPNLTEIDREKGRKIEGISEWRISVFQRDDYTCKKCGIKGGTLHAHHILNYATNKTVRTEVTNGVTLCKSCHKGFHKIYGNRRNNEVQLNQYLTKNC